MLSKEQIGIINNLVGEFSQEQLENVATNLEYYVHPELSIFVPLYKYCDYAVSPNHSHPGYSFIYNIKGRGSLKVEGREVSIKDVGDTNICAFSPGVNHQEIIEEGFSCYIAVIIKKELFEEVLKSYNVGSKRIFKGEFFPPDPELLYLLKSFMNEMRFPQKANKEVLNLWISLIIHRIIRITCLPKQEIIAVSTQEKIEGVINYMYEHVSEKLSVDEMAAYANLSSSHFTKIFKKLQGKTPIEFLTRIRIEKAKMLLRSDNLNLTEIAFDCGFSSSSYFSHTFIDMVGVTPSEYRKNLKG